MKDTLESRLQDAGRSLAPPAFDERGFQARAAAAGAVDVAYATVDSPLGELLLAATPRGLARIAYLGETARDPLLVDLAARLSPRVLEAPRALEEVRRQLDRYLAGRLRAFELALDWTLVGPFARRVLDRTAAIRYGEVATYGQIARETGSPRAARAAGNALARNPIPIVIPCHRVVRGGGALGGYGGGVERKARLLELEGSLGRTR